MIQQSATIQPTDAELLMRFTGARDDEAFRLLVERHAGLVLTVCRRVLGQRQDVEDVFQATFLVLARQAGSIRSSDSVASWLFKVAHRTAVRAARDCRHRAERPLAEDVAIPSEVLARLQQRETFELLAAELNRLPENYRAPLILFYLEGKSRRATADELDVSEAALKARLARGRKLLRRRLMRRGVALSLAMAVVTGAGQASEAAVSAALIQQTVAAGLSYAATGTASAACSAEIVSLAKGVQPMLTTTLTKSVLGVGVVLTAGLLVAVGVGSHASFAGTPKSGGPSIKTAVGSRRLEIRNEPMTRVAQSERDAADLAKYEKELERRAAAKKLLSALKETTEVEFRDTSLADSLKFIADLHEFRFGLSEDAKSQQAKPISVELSGVPVEFALTSILKPLGLTFEADGDVLKIVTVPKLETSSDSNGPASRTLDLSERNAAEEKIESALTEETEVEFIDTALKDAMEFLADQHKIRILLSDHELSEAGIATDEPITVVLSDVSLQSGLNIMLKPLGLTYVIEDEVMKITTTTVEQKRKETRVYAVNSLLTAGFDAASLQRVVETQGEAKTDIVGDAGVLVVTASQRSHRKILKLLQQLQQAAKLQGGE